MTLYLEISYEIFIPKYRIYYEYTFCVLSNKVLNLKMILSLINGSVQGISAFYHNRVLFIQYINENYVR